MRSYLFSAIVLGGLVVLDARCGGATDTLGNATPDASVDGKGGSSSSGGSSTSSSGSSGTSSGGSSGSSSSTGSGTSSGGSTSSSGGGSGGSSGTGSGSNSGSSSGAPACTVACTGGETCCDDKCVDEHDDPFNCGGCGVQCTGERSTCVNGACQAPPCETAKGNSCSSATTCCGNSCCTAGQICCVVEGGPAQAPRCLTPTAQQPTCPAGCQACQ